GMQFARVIKPGEREMVGSHQAGQETFDPLIDEAVGKLLARHEPQAHQLTSATGEMLPPHQMRICFVGVENKTAEEIGDFKEQIYELIDSRLLDSSTFVPISGRFVDVGLRQTRLRPDDLFVPGNLRTFTAVMEQQGQPFDYLLFAKLTSGTTRENKNYQRDYVLTLELVDIASGQQDKQSATLSKGYHHSRVSRAASKLWSWN
ncbi:MAG: penicillin-binding protein activator LpoB, partial [Planctomycetales bacterium]|nr:penicillin-binding protein activator LpoB [Planctomycetales bacterium]